MATAGFGYTGAAQCDGHFKEIDGTVAVEAEDYWEKSSAMVISDGAVGDAPKPISGGGMFITCEGRTNSWAKWKVDFTQPGLYTVWWLASAVHAGGDNFNVFLGTEPDKLRNLTSKQNCTIANSASCPHFEADIPDNKFGWTKGTKCIKGGCMSYSTIGKWDIKTPGTYYFGIHSGDEPFASHETACSSKNTPSMLIDKIMFIKGNSSPTGTGTNAQCSGVTSSLRNTKDKFTGSNLYSVSGNIIVSSGLLKGDRIRVMTLDGKFNNEYKVMDLNDSYILPENKGIVVLSVFRGNVMIHSGIQM
jgi:hypothetical protein